MAILATIRYERKYGTQAMNLDNLSEPIDPVPTYDELNTAARIKRIVASAVDGSRADWPLDAVCGDLLTAGATEYGCKMWRSVIAAERARLDLDAGIISREAFEALHGNGNGRHTWEHRFIDIEKEEAA